MTSRARRSGSTGPKVLLNIGQPRTLGTSTGTQAHSSPRGARLRPSDWRCLRQPSVPRTLSRATAASSGWAKHLQHWQTYLAPAVVAIRTSVRWRYKPKASCSGLGQRLRCPRAALIRRRGPVGKTRPPLSWLRGWAADVLLPRAWLSWRFPLLCDHHRKTGTPPADMYSVAGRPRAAIDCCCSIPVCAEQSGLPIRPHAFGRPGPRGAWLVHDESAAAVTPTPSTALGR